MKQVLSASSITALIGYVSALAEQGMNAIHISNLLPPQMRSNTLNQQPNIPRDALPNNLAYNPFTGWFYAPLYSSAAIGDDVRFHCHVILPELKRRVDVYYNSITGLFYYCSLDNAPLELLTNDVQLGLAV